MKIPLAWLQLTREKIRLIIALAGIGFADILMFMQLGFQDALFESSVVLHKRIEGDIFLLSPKSTAIIAMSQFSQRRLYQALALKGVREVHPIYLDFVIWKNPVTAEPRGIMLLGINPEDDFIDVPGLRENLDRVKLEDTILFDKLSRPEFGPIAELFDEGKTVTTEAGGKQLKVGGLFSLGASFGADGNILTSDINFLRLFPNRNKGLIDIGVISLEPGVDVESIKQSLTTILPQDVNIFTRKEFIDFEVNYWKTSTAIGFIFTLGVGMGFIVGIVIVYQILYTDVSDHLPEYATLKAMGYTDFYLLGVVFQEALILAFLGYIPGFLISNILYAVTAQATSLPLAMTVAKATQVIILTVIMCTASGAIAVRKLSAADPADIF
ncbi:ABC transporter permease DevC [Oscillatoria sp. FACHB-1406]|uniref:ABC transporter permease DevC n=1 Tax=Oscillatoria sp. FACHB-1406 TaxID=2692846 RepID=UPI001689C022|nr:ABC transporter permease DevC [Oscillatoria sp. FACHB-1406]MBD2576333.1 FtsX-like permease family protein [Oscillatoria sp. FACHB-1406]